MTALFQIEDYATEPTKVALIRLVQREYLTVIIHQVSLTHQEIIHPGYQQEREEVLQAIETQI